MKIANSVQALVGRTPLLDLSVYLEAHGISNVRLIGKLESFNPTSSVKDRAASFIIKAAQESGTLEEGGTLVEASSGNMGIALSALASALGYKMVVTMPETMSVERRKLMVQLGAELVLTDGALGMKGAIAEAERIAKERGGVLTRQFENQANRDAHYQATGPEIMEDIDSQVDYFVAGVGTGGTIMGAGSYLKEQNAECKLIAVEPKTSAVLSGEPGGKHGIQGIGAGFVPSIVDLSLIDEIIPVSTEDAISESQILGRTQGMLVGISSGAALKASLELAQRPESQNKTIVVVLPDTGERYLSTPLYN